MRTRYCFEVPRDNKDPLRIYSANGNTWWQDACDLELDHINADGVLKNLDKAAWVEGHWKIRVHSVFDAKHDGRHEATIVAEGHLNKETCDW